MSNQSNIILMERENDNNYLKAKKRVGKIKSFYTSLLSYVIFILFLAGLNYYTNAWRNPWFLCSPGQVAGDHRQARWRQRPPDH